ncbi:hypothetical protein J7T55_014306 [Diaporthe amygdali]|uniref:uncharacterized protein n=1 Tax=Phomopsis amygdali TaxID=1214568 RepID=UPI0022FE4EF5|nr:uncharacterized protein J7T55_014306 [Diaporthe amygdali]KAJ0117856.1 hypothetical protein J7T55_014306 [Diaporthe amygdali]
MTSLVSPSGDTTGSVKAAGSFELHSMSHFERYAAAAADESRRPPFNALMCSPAAKCNMMSCPACLRYGIGSKTACFKARTTWGWKLAADICHVKSDKPTV